MTDRPVRAWRWRVTATHPDWAVPGVIDVTATSAKSATSQARGWLLRMTGQIECMQATYTARRTGLPTSRRNTV